MNTLPANDGLKAWFYVFKKYPPQFRLAIIFTLLPIIILFPLLITIGSLLKSPTDNYDYDAIEKEGVTVQGIVTAIETKYNVRVNNQHPSVIHYTYQLQQQTHTDQFETMAPEKVSRLQAGDAVTLKVRDGQSMMIGLPPFKFPFFIFFLIPLVFLFIGIGFWIFLLVVASKEIRLYKNGNMKTARLVSISATTNRKNGSSYMVNYAYKDVMGQERYGASRTRDLTIVNKSKGDPLQILVDMNDESKSCLAPDR